MIQPTPIVPSNAPPQHDTIGSHHSSRVLQEHSGNRQQNDYSYHAPSEQKHQPAHQIENTYQGYQIPRPLPIYQQTPLQQRNAYRHFARRCVEKHDDPIELRRKVRYLLQRCHGCEAFSKYRERLVKGHKPGAEQIWPERLEFALFEALVKYPPRGRRQEMGRGKQRGRNELISIHIEEQTGETRTRKQVSSHVQTLRAFFQHDPYIVQFFPKTKDGQRDHSYHGNGRGMSGYPVTAPPQPVLPLATHVPFTYDISKFKDRLEIFEPTNFEMFVQRKVDLETSERLHTYTRTTTRRQHDQYIPDVETFGSEYPLLRSMGSLQPLDCNILAAEASIAFPIENCWTDRKNVELGISFLCTSKYLPPGVEISCRNSFYRNGLRDEGYSNTSYEHVCITTPSEDGSSLETQLKFGSAFWACNLGGTKNLIDRREEVAIFLKGVTAVQEIMFGSPNTGGERLLIIHWKFQLERAEPVGKAQWRRLRLDPTGVNLSPTKSENEEMKSERVDSNYEYAVRPMHIDPYQPAPPNALQSPFEYDNSSSSTGSALHSATWPTSASFDMGDGTSTAPPSAIEPFPPHGEDAFDFSGGTINISYDMDLSSFDTTTFDFEAGADFTTDPALQNYTASTQDGFGQQSYDTSWYDSFEGSQQPCPAPSEHHHNPSISAGATDELPPTDDFGFDIPSTCGAENQPLVAAYDAYPGSCYEDHYHSATYDVGPHETQAYEGAGQDVAVKDEGSLLALPEAGGVYLGPDRASSQVEEGNQRSG